MARDFVGINWGSSNFRAYLLNEAGIVQDSWIEASAIAALDRQGMEARIEQIGQRWPGAGTLYACGMIGSNIGWEEVAYVECPVDLDELALRLRPTPIAGRVMHIVPGLACRRAADDAPDIMRGEETELFGLLCAGRLPRQGIVALPGTHSKWVRIVDGRVEEFMTAMSGEIFDRLTAAGLLASIVGAPAAPGPAFDAGVRAGARGAPGLGTLLFGARARVIRKELDRDDAASYLRGLLIGAEIADVQTFHPFSADQTITLIGAGPVCAMYAQALMHLRRRSAIVDAADATARGFAALHAAAVTQST